MIGETDEAHDTLSLIRIGDAFASPIVAETVEEFLDQRDRTLAARPGGEAGCQHAATDVLAK